ncbi:MAG: SDR family oxidoreductase [Rhodobacteraceae bacterium]|nr:SDR family oxidoreductase [Paracoccaceae bacterium]
MPIAIITGASRGIGAATAVLAAEAGFDICINYLSNHDRAAEVVKACQSEGVRAISVAGDVAVESDVDTLFKTCDAQLGPVSFLVNNAGIIAQAARVENLPATALHRTFAVNFFGAFYCAQQAIKRMSTEHGGSGGTIVNVSSIAATNGSAGEYVHYAASKAALDGFTVGLAREVGREGIRVNSVQAGTADTEVHTLGGGNPDRPAMVARTSALGRVARADEIAQAILWLGSEKSSYATGAILRVGGGL